MEILRSGLVFTDGISKFKIPSSIANHMAQFAQVEETQPEAGGLLLGRWILDSVDAVVDEITIPVPVDWRSRFGFRRSSQAHQKKLNECWQRTGGTCNYLGEWHTHPEPEAKPSTRDIHSWERQVERLPRSRVNLYFVIVSTSNIAVWKVNRYPFSYKQLKQLK